jgi:hypothetical protein
VGEAIADRVADRIAAQQLAAETGRARVTDRAGDRLVLTKAQAAEALAMSADHLERHVLPELRIVRSGRLRLIPVSELIGWVERHAARPLESER